MLLLDACTVRRVPFIYASSSAVYGASGRFTEDPANEMPVSAYARSKAYFDQHVRNILADIRSPVTGLRFFNVYGLGEEHKGPMASVVYQMHEQARQNGKVEVFADLPGCADGEQQRDLITIGDAVRVTLWFLTQASRPGIYNVGTGEAVSFNDIAELVLAHRGGGTIDYVPLPVRLRETYQILTKADLRALREAGYPHALTSPEAGIRADLQQLSPPAGKAWTTAAIRLRMRIALPLTGHLPDQSENPPQPGVANRVDDLAAVPLGCDKPTPA
jgi:ADP-L-glycero-D-manno-heptose 6-epimerase